MNVFFKLISYVFHPLLFSFFGTFLYLYLSPKSISKTQEYIIIAIIFFSTYLLPIVLLFILKQLKMIKSYHLNTIEERKFPTIFILILSFMLGKMLLKTTVVDLLAYSFFGISLALIITYFLYPLKIKTSLHTLGVGGIVGFITTMSYEYQSNYNFIIAVLFILSGIIAVSRLKLNAHKPKEVYIGFLIGFTTQLINYQIYNL